METLLEGHSVTGDGTRTCKRNPELRNLRKKYHCTSSLQGPDGGETDPKVQWEEHESGNLPSLGKLMYDPQRKDILAITRVGGGLKSLVVLPSLTLPFVEGLQQPTIVE